LTNNTEVSFPMSGVSLVSQFRNTENILMNQSRDLQDIRETIASGKKVREPSDNPTAVVNINEFSNQIDDLEQFDQNITSARNQLENSEATMGELSGLLQRTRQIAVQANNDTLNQDDRVNIAAEVDQRLEQAVRLANSQLGGEYIFSGAETSTSQKPFQVERNGEGEIIEVNYHGDSEPKSAKTSPDQTIQKNIIGHRLFQATNHGVVGGQRFNYEGELDKTLSNTVGYQQIDSPPPAKTVTGIPTGDTGAGSKTSLQVSNAGAFQVGDEVRIIQDGGNSAPGATGDQDFETTTVTRVDTSDNAIEVDLKNNYDVSGSNSVTVAKSSGSTRQQVTGGQATGGGPAGDLPAAGYGNTFGNDTSATVDLNNTDGLEVGDKVTIEDSSTGASETRIVQNVSGTQIQVDLSETTVNDKFTNNATVQKVAEETRPNGKGYFKVGDSKVYYDTSQDSVTDIAQRINDLESEVKAVFVGQSTENGEKVEYQPGEVAGQEDGPYRLKLKSRVPKKVALKDFDRQPGTTPDQVEGLLNDLQFLGSGEGSPPEPKETQDFPNTYNTDATITGKSIFDAMIDLREGLQPADDADGDSDSTTGEFNIPKGNASRNAFLDPETIPTLQQSLEDFSSAIQNVSLNRAVGGARLNRLESARERINSTEQNAKSILSKLQDANLAETVTELRSQQAVRQAALRMTSQVANQTLANFI
jgi:flagellar hook-associated protein 3